ncbi:MAG: hypothetical protein AAGA54_20825 [Myxococcota bacterium]
MKRAVVWLGILAGGCGPEVLSGSQAGGAARCLDAPRLLHVAPEDEFPYATPWPGGYYLVGSAGIEPTYNVLDPCTGELESIDHTIDTIFSSEEVLMACDAGSGAVYPVDPFGVQTGATVTVARGCHIRSSDLDGEPVWLGQGDDGQLHLFDTDGTYAVVHGVRVGSAPWVDSTWGTNNPDFAVMDNGSLWMIDARDGAPTLVATGVSEPFVRGHRVFFRSTMGDQVQVYDAETNLSRELPSSLFEVACTLGLSGDWYVIPPEEQAYCTVDSAVAIIHVVSGERYDVPAGFLVRDPVSADELLLVGDTVEVWTPSTNAWRTIWNERADGAVLSSTAWGGPRDAVSFLTQRSGVIRQLLVPLDGREPFGLFGEHPSGLAYYADEKTVLGLTPESALVEYDRTTDALDVIAPKIVSALYYAAEPDRGHPGQLLYEVGDLFEPDVPREFWAMPVP